MKVIRDPIHKNVSLNDVDIKIIDTETFQRLRRIKQLGVVHLTFPGAHHTRFEHSLGARYLASVVLSSLQARGCDLDPEMVPLVEVSALLHDIAHPPFSHVVDELLSSSPYNMGHERVIERKLRGTDLADVVEESTFTRDEILSILRGRRGFYSKIIKSDIDVDRLDYLLRDSFYCGVSYGIFDEKIILELRRHGDDLVVTEKGVGPAENVLFARFQMHTMVYNHKTVRATASMIRKAVSMAIKEGAIRPEEIYDMDDSSILVAMVKRCSEEVAQIVNSYANRWLYKRAYWKNWFQLEKEQLNMMLELQRNRVAIEEYEEEIANAAGVSPHEVCLDVPKAPILEEVRVKVLFKDGSVKELSEISPTAKSLSESFKYYWYFQVCSPREHVESVRRACQRIFEA